MVSNCGENETLKETPKKCSHLKCYIMPLMTEIYFIKIFKFTSSHKFKYLNISNSINEIKSKIFKVKISHFHINQIQSHLVDPQLWERKNICKIIYASIAKKSKKQRDALMCRIKWHVNVETCMPHSFITYSCHQTYINIILKFFCLPPFWAYIRFMQKKVLRCVIWNISNFQK